MNVAKGLFFIIFILSITAALRSAIVTAQNPEQGSRVFSSSSINQHSFSPVDLLQNIILTDEQNAKVLQLKNRYENAVQEVLNQINNGKIKKEKGIKKISDLAKSLRRKLHDLLDDEQKAIFAANVQRENQKNKQETRISFKPDEELISLPRLSGVLSLTDSQKTAITNLIDSYKKSLQELRARVGATSPEERIQLLEELNTLNKTVSESVNNQLTDAQKAKLSDIRKSQSQSQQNPRDFRVEIARWQQKLSLTDSQKVSIGDIYRKYDVQLKPLGDQLKDAVSNDEKDEIAGMIRELIVKRSQEISALLTTDQQTLYRNLQNRLYQRASEMQKLNIYEPWTTRFADELQLTTDQAQKVRASERRYAQLINQIVQKMKSAKEEDRLAIQQRLHQLLSSRDNDIRDILTDGQQAKFDELKAMISERKSEADQFAVASSQKSKDIPFEYALGQNYPNPFNPTTEISYQLPEATQVSLVIYSLLGQKIATLIDGVQRAGYYAVGWDGKDDAGNFVATGIYFYRLITPKFTSTRKMMLMK